jgi:hypothetical protein
MGADRIKQYQRSCDDGAVSGGDEMSDSPRHNVGSIADPHWVVDEEHYLKAMAALERITNCDTLGGAVLNAVEALKECGK